MSAMIFEAVAGLDIKLPNGDTVHAKPLGWRKAIEFLALMEKERQAGKDNNGILVAVMDRLPEAVGLPAGTFDSLDFGDANDLVSRFFHLKQNGNGATDNPPALTT